MKAVIKTLPGEGNVELLDIEEPSVPPGHVKIAVRATGICGTDLHIYHDEFRSWPPVVLGHEVSGEIAEVGDGVSSVRPGDRVTTETYFSTCGSCRFCRSGRLNLCPERRSIGSAVNGGFTSYLIVPERNVHILPPNVSFLAGALTEPLACVVHGALELPRLVAGDVAVVAGPGAIGLLTLQVVKAMGTVVVVLGTDADANRLRKASELGADRVLNVQQDDYRAVVDDLTEGSGADVVYECSGAGPSATSLLDLVKELTVTGSNASVPSAWARALRLMADGMVDTETLVSDVLPVTEWRLAFDKFENRSGLKTVLQPV
jgi:L-iditol 2-dehydrogenase